jgi:hypothetical protein
MPDDAVAAVGQVARQIGPEDRVEQRQRADHRQRFAHGAARGLEHHDDRQQPHDVVERLGKPMLRMKIESKKTIR